MINPFDTHFKMIATNTGASSVQEAADKAEVFLFCESHNNRKYQIANSQAFDFLWRPDAKFFVEARVQDHIPLARKEIHVSAQHWQDIEAIDQMFSEVEDEKDLLLESSNKFTNFLFAVVNLDQSDTSDDDEDMPLSALRPLDPERVNELFRAMSELNKYPFFASVNFPVRDNFDKSQIDPLLKSLAQGWCNFMMGNLRRVDQMIDAAAGVRNRMLTDTLIKAHREGARRIIAVSGSDHVKIPKEAVDATPAIVTAIDHLYKALQEAGIHYVTLKATNKHLETMASSSAEIGQKRSASVAKLIEPPPPKKQEIAESSEEMVRVEDEVSDDEADSDSSEEAFDFMGRAMKISMDTFRLRYSDSSTISDTHQIHTIYTSVMRPIWQQGVGALSSPI